MQKREIIVLSLLITLGTLSAFTVGVIVKHHNTHYMQLEKERDNLMEDIAADIFARRK